MDLENPITIRRLPLLRNFEDAEALYKKKGVSAAHSKID
jgi:hypothetical protein